jgi:ribosomal protein S20
VCFASDEMTDSDEYRVKAAELRAQAERERDPLFRSMFKTLSKRYLRLAQQADDERNAKLAYKSSPPIAADDPKRR